LHPSFESKYEFFKTIDALPIGIEWTVTPIEVKGDLADECGHTMIDSLEIWSRDPVECIKDLLGNPSFKDQMHYAPERHYSDESGQEQLFSEMWTGDWWWEMQVRKFLGISCIIRKVLIATISASYLQGLQLLRSFWHQTKPNSHA
jgi:Plavaka transposase